MARRFTMLAWDESDRIAEEFGEQEIDLDSPAWQDEIVEMPWRGRAAMHADNHAYVYSPQYRERALEAAKEAGGFHRAAVHERLERRMGGEFHDEKTKPETPESIEQALAAEAER